jgi:hypothetical protein
MRFVAFEPRGRLFDPSGLAIVHLRRDVQVDEDQALVGGRLC